MNDHYQTSFPQSKNKFLKAESFQDKEVSLTFKGWKKKANEDDPATKPNAKTWKQKLIYVLRYSYPEFALDEAGEKKLGKDGQPFRNSYYDPNYPKGYSIIYAFNEGELESGSKPLFEQFCMVAPRPGERLLIKRTGKDKETKWFVTRASERFHKDDVPTIDVNASELQPDENLPWEQGN